MITREEALELLKKYNKEEFHIHHGLMVEGTMRYFAEKHVKINCKNETLRNTKNFGKECYF